MTAYEFVVNVRYRYRFELYININDDNLLVWS